MTYISSTLK